MAKSANDNMMTRPHYQTDTGRPACMQKLLVIIDVHRLHISHVVWQFSLVIINRGKPYL